MKSLPLPTVTTETVLAEIGNSSRADALRLFAAELVDGQIEYLQNARVQEFRLTNKGHPSMTSADEAEVLWAWKQRLSAKSGSARFIYDKIRSSAPGNRCPLCLHRVVHDLDHFLPKSAYPRLSIVPANLVPICSDCNGAKGSFVASNAEEEPLHPYFDELGSEPWLDARLVEAPGLPVVFGIAPPPKWSSGLSQRVSAQFNRLGLAGLYGDEASSLLANIVGLLEVRLRDGGLGAVRLMLVEMADSWSRPNNEPYLVAALRSWAASDYACSGGWRL